MSGDVSRWLQTRARVLLPWYVTTTQCNLSGVVIRHFPSERFSVAQKSDPTVCARTLSLRRVIVFCQINVSCECRYGQLMDVAWWIGLKPSSPTSFRRVPLQGDPQREALVYSLSSHGKPLPSRWVKREGCKQDRHFHEHWCCVVWLKRRDHSH